MPDNDNEAAIRAELIAYVATTDWDGPMVRAHCENCPLDELQMFVKALETGNSPVLMLFRWALDEDRDWFPVVYKPE